VRTLEKALSSAKAIPQNLILRSDQGSQFTSAEFAYDWYNQVRPHSYNKYLTPFEKRAECSIKQWCYKKGLPLQSVRSSRISVYRAGQRSCDIYGPQCLDRNPEGNRKYK